MRRLVVVFLLVLFTSPSFFAADICEAINDVSNGWNDVANFLNEVGDDDVSEDTAQRLEEYVTDLATGTYALADALVDAGNAAETKLGVQMRKQMSAISNAKKTGHMVQLVDSLVDTLDKTTDYCDSVNE